MFVTSHAYLGLLTLALIAGGMLFPQRWSEGICRTLAAPWAENRGYVKAALISVIGLVASLIIALYVLQEFPNSADEYATIFQAQTFDTGRLYNPLHPAQEYFSVTHIGEKEGKWVSRFPPGLALVYAAAMRLQVSLAYVNPFLGAALLLYVFLIAKRYASQGTALLASVLLLISPFFLFNSASYFSHPLCALAISASLYSAMRQREEGLGVHALLAGAWCGMAFLTRPLSGVLGGLITAIYLLRSLHASLNYRLLLFPLGGMPFLVFWGWYNYQITGHALLPVTT